jgi:hypothetical protein
LLPAAEEQDGLPNSGSSVAVTKKFAALGRNPLNQSASLNMVAIVQYFV